MVLQPLRQAYQDYLMQRAALKRREDAEDAARLKQLLSSVLDIHVEPVSGQITIEGVTFKLKYHPTMHTYALAIVTPEGDVFVGSKVDAGRVIAEILKL